MPRRDDVPGLDAWHLLDTLYPTPAATLRRLHVASAPGDHTSWRTALDGIPERDRVLRGLIRLACDDYPSRGDLPAALEALLTPEARAPATDDGLLRRVREAQASGLLESRLATLSGPRWQALQRALLSAFRGYPEFERLMQFQFGVNLAEVSEPTALDTVAYKVIAWAQSRGCTGQLVAAALASRSDNPLLGAFAHETLA